MTPADLIAFVRRSRLAVEATVAPGGAPQAAVVGFAVSDQLELVFDTLTTTRKFQNLIADPRIALVIGWDHAITAQLEGIADVPTGAERDRLKAVYFAAYPDGRDREQWANITWVRVRPTWVKYSDFTQEPPRIEELALDCLDLEQATTMSKTQAPTAEKYTYRVIWSEQDKEHVGLCAEFPSLSWLAPSMSGALNGITTLVVDVLADMAKSREKPPVPLSHVFVKSDDQADAGR